MVQSAVFDLDDAPTPEPAYGRVPGCEGLTLDLDALWRGLDQRLEREHPESG